ncbi:hypothetical protein UFOVP1158_8 [uncultured Caudovirales phage]|uniref:Uncharacterized protein n=1 Tax=uncultured Caudovirales phage TaxID=2100421 RepID=A0A6J5QRX2_9CAUD|nr:hypothetical protein UFOVP1158_8 [uncultured Caudovirales phage]
MSEWDDIEACWVRAHNLITDQFVFMDPIVYLEKARERYQRGAVEHADAGSTWESWTTEDFASNIDEEILDTLIYTAKLVHLKGTL